MFAHFLCMYRISHFKKCQLISQSKTVYVIGGESPNKNHLKIVFYRSLHGLLKWETKLRTWIFHYGISFTICTNWFHLPKTNNQKKTTLIEVKVRSRSQAFWVKRIIFGVLSYLPACRRLLFPLLHEIGDVCTQATFQLVIKLFSKWKWSKLNKQSKRFLTDKVTTA